MRLLHQPPPVATLGHRNLDLVLCRLAQRLRQQIALGQRPVDQHGARRRHFFVELHDDASEDFVLVDILRVRGEERAVAPVLPAADEERLHRDLPALGSEREDVRIAHPGRVHGLRALNEGRRAQPVAQYRGGFEVELLRSLCHLLFEVLLDGRGLATEEILGLLDQLFVPGLVDPPDAGGRAALDLVEQAGPVAIGEKAVCAGS